MKEKMKFDVVVGNPPYIQGLHLKFLELSYNISNEWIIWIQPSNWILDRRGTNKNFEKIKELINSHIVEITLINGNPIFNITNFTPLMISVINKDQENKGILVKDKILEKEIKYNSLWEINKWGDKKIYPSLEKKILEVCAKDNLYNHLNKKEGEKYVNIAVVAGHPEIKNPNKMVKDDFYRLFPKDKKVSNKIEKEGTRSEFFFSFPSDSEANNFINFMKTKIAMFSLSIFKIDQNITGNFLATTPWLDWSKSWTEKDFESLIDATPEEIKFVNDNLPDYYGIPSLTNFPNK